MFRQGNVPSGASGLRQDGASGAPGLHHGPRQGLAKEGAARRPD